MNPQEERELRERLAAEIEAERYDSDVPTTVKEQGRNWGLSEAARIVRGATADTDPAPDNTTERT